MRRAARAMHAAVAPRPEKQGGAAARGARWPVRRRAGQQGESREAKTPGPGLLRISGLLRRAARPRGAADVVGGRRRVSGSEGARARLPRVPILTWAVASAETCMATERRAAAGAARRANTVDAPRTACVCSAMRPGAAAPAGAAARLLRRRDCDSPADAVGSAAVGAVSTAIAGSAACKRRRGASESRRARRSYGGTGDVVGGEISSSALISLMPPRLAASTEALAGCCSSPSERRGSETVCDGMHMRGRAARAARRAAAERPRVTLRTTHAARCACRGVLQHRTSCSLAAADAAAQLRARRGEVVHASCDVCSSCKLRQRLVT
jgi:hypothetical protein